MIRTLGTTAEALASKSLDKDGSIGYPCVVEKHIDCDLLGASRRFKARRKRLHLRQWI